MNYNSIEASSLKDNSTEIQILANVMHNPEFMLDDEYSLIIDDFTSRRNKIIYASILNLAKQGVSTITPQDLDNYLREYPDQYELFKSEGITTFLNLYEANQELKDKAKFNILYKQLKKYSLLRDLQKAGISTKEFYSADVLTQNEFSTDMKEFSIDDCIKTIKDRVNDIDLKYQDRNAVKGISVAEGLQELIEQYKITPAIGSELDGEIYNYAVRGARLGKLYLISSHSGGGKTRRMAGQACALSLPYINEFGEIVVKSEYKPVLFISTEQDVHEIQTLVLSYVSGVNEAKITDGCGDCTAEELRRIELAIKIIELFKDYLMLEQIPDPSIGLVKSKILYYIYKRNVQYIFYDYIFSSPSLLNEFSGLRIREDVVLMMLSNALKEIATNNNVFVMSGTQLSGEYNKPCFRGMGFLRGSKSIADKIDIGVITVRLQPDEELEIASIQETMNCRANVVTDIYKNRNGILTQVKIFSSFDYGTCHIKDLFLTDLTYVPFNDYKVLKEQRKTYKQIEELKQYKIEMETYNGV